jgi:hypothetical protein
MIASLVGDAVEGSLSPAQAQLIGQMRIMAFVQVNAKVYQHRGDIDSSTHQPLALGCRDRTVNWEQTIFLGDEVVSL